jgi:hypothetical protein
MDQTTNNFNNESNIEIRDSFSYKDIKLHLPTEIYSE